MNKKYLLNPFDAIYQDDKLLSNKPEIQEINQYAIDLENRISGDFNLEYLTFEFAYNQLAFVRNGLLLAKIKFLKLYKNCGDGTFAHFCKYQLRKQRWQINDTIKAARVVLELMYAGFEVLPTNISQAVALAKLTTDELIQKWRDIISTLPLDRITAKTITSIVNPAKELESENVTLKIPAEVSRKIETEAFSRDLSVVQFLKLILEFFLESETAILQGDADSLNFGVNSHLLSSAINTKEYKEKQRIWQEDLIELGQTGLVTS